MKILKMIKVLIELRSIFQILSTKERLEKQNIFTVSRNAPASSAAGWSPGSDDGRPENESGNEHTRTMRADRLVAVKEEEPKNPIDKAIAEREKTIYGIYSDIGTALDDFTTSELVEYYIERFGSGVLRDFVEQQIIAAEISKEKEAI